jgi:hypothetical protein
MPEVLVCVGLWISAPPLARTRTFRSDVGCKTRKECARSRDRAERSQTFVARRGVPRQLRSDAVGAPPQQERPTGQEGNQQRAEPKLR